MKESSCHDAKMEAYCQEVRRLEDRFDGLELNHIPRRLNEAADALAKASSGREPVPVGIFASDQHKPSVRYTGSEQADDGPSIPIPGANPPIAPPDPEVMVLEEEPAAESDPPDDWRTLYLDYLLRNILPMDKTEARRLARRAKSFVLVEGKLYKRSHIRILQLCIPSEQGNSCWATSMVESVVIMPHQEPWLEMHSDKAFTGPPQ